MIPSRWWMPLGPEDVPVLLPTRFLPKWKESRTISGIGIRTKSIFEQASRLEHEIQDLQQLHWGSESWRYHEIQDIRISQSSPSSGNSLETKRACTLACGGGPKHSILSCYHRLEKSSEPYAALLTMIMGTKWRKVLCKFYSCISKIDGMQKALQATLRAYGLPHIPKILTEEDNQALRD